MLQRILKIKINKRGRYTRRAKNVSIMDFFNEIRPGLNKLLDRGLRGD